MKKFIVYFCLSIFIISIMSACSMATMPGSDTTDASKESNQAEYEQNDVSISSEQNEVAIPSEQNEVYFATGNDYYDLYCGYSWVPGPEIRILSREHIDPDKINVSVDIEADYTVMVTELERHRASLATYEITESEGKRSAYMVTANAFDFPLYLYQTYAGIDWKEVGKLYTEYVELQEKYDAEEVSSDQVTDAADRYHYAETEYIHEYNELHLEDVPRFYEYTIQIRITSAEVEETLKTVQVTINDSIYDVSIGEVYIRPYLDINNGYDYFSMQRSPSLLFNSLPYGKGVEPCRSGTYCAEASLTLTGLHFLENSRSSLEVLDVVAVIADDADSAQQGDGIVIEWDGVTPIYVEQGKYVCFFITVQDDRMKEINYHSNLYPVWKFECGESTYQHAEEIPLYRVYSDAWLLYAMGMDGLDMESYFNDYYYLQPANNWRSDVDLTPWGQEQ